MIGFRRVQAICALGLLITLASGCSKRETATTLARRLGEADRVTVAEKYPRQGTSAMPLTAEEANRLVRALASAKKESGVVTATPELRIDFFKGTNLMSGFDVGVTVFWIDQGPDADRPGFRRQATYSDSTGTLEMLGRKYWHANPSRSEVP
jgi:hypothetical protein